MKILFVFPYPSQTAASQRFRFEQYLDLLEKEGIEYDLAPFLDIGTWEVLYKKGHHLKKIIGIIRGFSNRFFLLFRLTKYDFIFVHREASPLFFPFFEFISAVILRKKIIFDFDDAIWIPNTTEENKWISKLKFHSKTALIIRWAYKVSAGNRFLAEYARKSNPAVIVNPTTIDTEKQHNPELFKKIEQKDPTIGWTGTHSTLVYLQEIIPVIRELEKKYTFQFLVIADKNPDFDLKSFQFKPWNIETEIEDLMQIDIGLMPLQEDKWAKGKCGFKALQYMALEIPALVSPVGVNPDIVRNEKDGFVCFTEEDWLFYLSDLLENEEKRIAMGKNARQQVIENYSFLSNSKNFLSFFGK